MRTWIVTGASRGIGRAIAARALALGDQVVLMARSQQALDLPPDVADRALPLQVDVSRADSAADGVSAAVSAFGPIDVLVNNAGVHRGGRVERLSLDDWDRVLATNLTGPLIMTRAALPHMREGSSVVNIGAVVGFRGFPGDSPYGAAKAGLAGLTTVLAMELAGRGIRVNLVVPGFVETEMTGDLSDRARELIVERIPLRRTGSPEEIAEVVAWVAGAPYMTGSVVATDGGLLAAMGSGA